MNPDLSADLTGAQPSWLLTGSLGMWVADCLAPGCLWTLTASTPEAVDIGAHEHAVSDHAQLLELLGLGEG